jgi:hypothetical protein
MVACALPSGLQATYGGETVVFKGANDEGAIVGFGVTTGVDKDWFDKWVESMGKDFTPLNKGLIFARASGIADEIKERAPETVTGFEGIDGNSPGPGLEKVDAPKG